MQCMWRAVTFVRMYEEKQKPLSSFETAFYESKPGIDGWISSINRLCKAQKGWYGGHLEVRDAA